MNKETYEREEISSAPVTVTTAEQAPSGGTAARPEPVVEGYHPDGDILRLEDLSPDDFE